MRKSIPVVAFVVALAFAASLVLVGCGNNVGNTAVEATHTNEKTDLSSSDKTKVYNYDATAEVTVGSVTLDYYPAKADSREDKFTLDILDPKNSGEQYIRFDVEVANTGEEDFPFYDGVYFKLQPSSKGYTDTTFITGLSDDPNTDEFTNVSEIPIGETVSGAVYFQIPETDTLADLKLFYESSKMDADTFEIQEEKIELPL